MVVLLRGVAFFLRERQHKLLAPICLGFDLEAGLASLFCADSVFESEPGRLIHSDQVVEVFAQPGRMAGRKSWVVKPPFQLANNTERRKCRRSSRNGKPGVETADPKPSSLPRSAGPPYG